MTRIFKKSSLTTLELNKLSQENLPKYLSKWGKTSTRSSYCFSVKCKRRNKLRLKLLNKIKLLRRTKEEWILEMTKKSSLIP
jgi:hypothetical protein